MAAKFELYQDRAGKWRWTLRHRNGQIIADGAEAYESRRSAMGGIRSVQRNAPKADVAVRDAPPPTRRRPNRRTGTGTRARRTRRTTGLEEAEATATSFLRPGPSP